MAGTPNDIALERIREAKATGSSVLDLSGLGLESVPAGLGSLTSLTELNLNDNQLSLVPAELGSLTSLRGLRLASNQLSSVPAELGSLTSLTALDLSKNQLRSVPAELGSLTSLTALDLSKNQLRSVPAELGSLTSLTTLDLSKNQLCSVPAELASLTSLLELRLYFNQLSSLPAALGSLASLRALYLFNNELSSVPAELGSLTSLKVLDLSGNKLSSIPAELGSLTSLKTLDLVGNPQLGLSPQILRSSPRAILDAYFGSLGKDSRPLNEVKLIVVGRGAAGKTSLVRALRGEPFEPEEERTSGIALSDWEMECKKSPVTAHVWDFAGQVITHSLHQFFFSVRSVYILALTGRENSEREDAEYWLRLIRAFGTDADGNGPPVIVALNKWDVDGCQPKLDRGAIQERYPFIRGFAETDCKTERGIEKLRKALAKEVDGLPYVREKFNGTWDSVRRSLEPTPGSKSYMTFDQFRKRCAEHGVTDEDEQDSLAEVLHNLGIALNYRSFGEDVGSGRHARLREATVLRPHWLTDNVYKIVRKAEAESGILDSEGVKKVLYQRVRKPEMREYLMRLMELFEIAYAAPGVQGRWVVPQALADVQPKGVELFAKEPDATRLRYSYQALPEGLVARAIVRLHDLIEKKKQWASGAIFEREGARALLRTEPQDRQVMLTVTGPEDARRQLAGLCRDEMRSIHAEIPGLDPTEEAQEEGEWVRTSTLEFDEKEGRNTGIATKSRGTIPIDPRRVNNKFSVEAARTDAFWKPRVFICYSKENIDQRKKLEQRLKILRNDGKLAEHWHDRMIDPGDRWDKAIKSGLDESDIFIVLTTDALLATDYVTEIEIPRAIELEGEGKLVIVSVILQDGLWSTSELASRQVLPEKGKALNEWNPRSAGWKSISAGISRVADSLIEARKNKH
ncbi:MAG: COR domain-containing protein [Planctomycetota bacterium]